MFRLFFLVAALVATTQLRADNSRVEYLLEELARLPGDRSSHDRQREIARWLETKLQPLDFQSEWHARQKLFVATHKGHSDFGTIVLVAHMDGPSAPEAREIRRAPGDLLVGHHILDNNAGMISALWAAEKILRTPGLQRHTVKVLIAGDEEVLATHSGKLFVKEARGASLGLVFEPAWTEVKSDGLHYFVPTNIPGILRVDLKIKTEPKHSAIDPHTMDASDIFVSILHGLRTLQLSGSLKASSGKFETKDGYSVAKAQLTYRYLPREGRETLISQLEELRAQILAQLLQEIESLPVEERKLARIPKIQFELKNRSRPGRLIITQRLWRALERARQAAMLPLPERGLSLTWDLATLLTEAGVPSLTSMGPEGGRHHKPSEFVRAGTVVTSADIACATALEFLGRKFTPEVQN